MKSEESEGEQYVPPDKYDVGDYIERRNTLMTQKQDQGIPDSYNEVKVQITHTNTANNVKASGGHTPIQNSTQRSSATNSKKSVTIGRADKIVNYPKHNGEKLDMNINLDPVLGPAYRKYATFTEGDLIPEKLFHTNPKCSDKFSLLADASDGSVSRRKRRSLRKSARSKSVRGRSHNPINGMPCQTEIDNISTLRETFVTNNQMLGLANQIAPGISAAITHYEFVDSVYREMTLHKGSYGDWLERDIGTIAKLLVTGVRHRATKLLEAYKTIGLITQEIGMDFPNRVTLLQGKREGTDITLHNEKVKNAIIRLYSKLGCISIDELEEFAEMAASLTNLDEPTDPEIALILKEVFYIN